LETQARAGLVQTMAEQAKGLPPMARAEPVAEPFPQPQLPGRR